VADSKPRGPVTFTKPLAARIGRAVKKVEARYGNSADERRDDYRVPFLPIQPASVTTAIPSGSLGSPSTAGRVTIYRDSSAGGLVAAETGQKCYNYHTLTASVPAGTTISVYWRAGVWWLLQPDCY
jgi:hypothetical protein